MDQRRLGQPVDRTLVGGNVPHLAGDMDDPSAALFAHGGQHRLAGKERGSQVYGNDAIKFRTGKGTKILVVANTRIVDQHIDPAEGGQRRSDHRFRLIRQAEVELAVFDPRRAFHNGPAFRRRCFQLRRRAVSREKQ